MKLKTNSETNESSWICEALSAPKHREKPSAQTTEHRVLSGLGLKQNALMVLPCILHYHADVQDEGQVNVACTKIKDVLS